MIRHRLAALASAVARAIETLRAAKHVEAVAADVIETLGLAASSEQATFWTVDPQLRQLRAIAHWNTSGFTQGSSDSVQRYRAPSWSEGSAARVWRTRKPLWSASSILDTSRRPSIQDGLRGGVWFAVKTDTSVYGVIELLGRALEPSAPENLVHIERLGFRLGHALEELRHGRAHLHLRWQ
jgi:hypothetical protein